MVYVMIRDRNFRDYMIAAPVSFLKVLGYFAFPLQMVTAYPALARFMAARGATRAVRVVPVFGEKGALLEHAVFDLLFNRPRVFGRWARQRIRGLLDLWLVLGAAGGVALATWRGRGWATREWVNLALTVLVVFVLPRALFYPMLRWRTHVR